MYKYGGESYLVKNAHNLPIIRDYIGNDKLATTLYDEMKINYISDRIKTKEYVPVSGQSDAQKWKHLGTDRDYIPLVHDFLNPDEYQRDKDIIINNDFMIYGIRVARSFTLINLEIDVNLDPYIADVMNNVGCYAEVSRRFKLLGDFMKKHGSFLTDNWFKYVNIETSFCYESVENVTDPVSEISDWVCGNVEHILPLNNGKNLFYLYFAEGVTSVFNGLSAKQRREIDIINSSADYEDNEFTNNYFLSDYTTVGNSISDYYSFVMSGSWARRGSSSVKISKYATIKGKDIRLANTKNSLFVYGDLEHLFKSSLEPEREQYGKAIAKRERGKVRWVCGMDVETYLLMSYIDQYLVSILSGCDKSTLWMNSLQKSQFDIKRCKDTTEGLYWNVPLDQSSFDHMISNEMIVITLLVIKDILSSRGFLTSHIKYIMWLIYRRLGDNRYSGYVSIDDNKVKIEHGVLSGWKWTALMDTMINIGELETVKRVLKNYGYTINITYNAQGDDDDIVIDNLSHAILLCHCYKYMNFKINPKKFFIKKMINEYLRKIYIDGIMTGYMARMVLTFVEINPIREKQSSQLAMLNASVKNWVDFFKRCDPRGSSLGYISTTKSNYMVRMLSKDIGYNMDNLLFTGDHIIRRFLTDLVVVSKNLKLGSSFAIIMGVGMGKSTLYSAYPELFIDVDILIRNSELIRLPLVANEQWDNNNNLIKARLSGLGNLNRILLCHTDGYLPEFYSVIGVINSFSLNKEDVKVEEGSNSVRYNVLMKNREHIHSSYRYKYDYYFVNTNRDKKKAINKIINKTFGSIESYLQSDIDIKSDNKYWSLTSKGIKGGTIVKLDLKYRDKDKIKITSHLFVELLQLYNVKNLLKISEISDEHGINNVDIFEDELVAVMGDDIKNQLFIRLGKLFQGLLPRVSNNTDTFSKIYNWLTTPGYLGGSGCMWLDTARRENGISAMFIKTRETIIEPDVEFPPSNIVNKYMSRLQRITGKQSNLSNIYNSTKASNKSFRDVGTIEFRLTFDNYIANKRLIFYSVDAYVNVLNRGGDIKQIRIKNRPKFNEIFQSNVVMQEGIIEIISGMHTNELDSNFLSKVFRNIELILLMQKKMSRSFWRQWLVGRIDIPKPVRLDVSAEIIGNYYTFCTDALISNYSSLITQNVILNMCKTIELICLDEIVSKMRKELGVSIL